MRSKVPAGMSIEDAIQFARTDQSTPRELASVVSKKYRLVVSVTTKSLDPSCFIPAYQVHRIDQEHGKTHRGSALGRRPGLAIASTSSSTAGSGLNPSGEILAETLGIVGTNSSETLAAASDAPASIDMPSSVVASGKNLPETPQSVSKPAGPTVDKSPTISEVKRALLMETSPEREMATVKDLAPPADVTKTGLAFLPAPDSPHTSSSANPDKSTPKRRQAPKATGDESKKRGRN